MQITIQGKQMDVGDALRTHVEEKLGDINSKYFNNATFATVTFAKEGHGHGQIKAHIHIQVGKNIMVMSDCLSGDPYGAFDAASEKVAKQMRRYKKRLRDHHERLEQTPESEIMKARDYVLAVEPERKEEDKEPDDGVPHGEDPVIVAELATSIQTMSVGEAVMRMDLSGQPALMFRNVKNDELNMVYRREDGNIGWVDPSEAATTGASKAANA